MKHLIALASVLTLATVVSVGARSTNAPACVAHSHVAGISDPNPADCPLCAGDPQIHVRAMWAIEKEVAAVYRLRML